METVYIVGIVAAAVVIVGVVWLLRDRIIGGSAEASLKERKAKASFRAAKPAQKPGGQPQSRGSAVREVSQNVNVGKMSVIASLRARIVRNLNLGRMDITMTDTPPPPATPDSRRDDEVQ